MHKKTRIRITAQGVYYVLVMFFILGGAIIREVNMLVLLSGMLCGPLLLHWRMVKASMCGLTVQRNAPAVVTAGKPFQVDMKLTNSRQRLGSWAVKATDELLLHDGSTSGLELDVVFDYVGAQSDSTLSCYWQIPKRGKYSIGLRRIETSFPLGILRCFGAPMSQTEIVVMPHQGHLTPQWTNVIESDHHGLNDANRRRGYSEGDYYALRDWRSGDSTRWIHWRTTARVGDLMVRQFEQQRDRAVGVILDLHTSEQSGNRIDSNDELAEELAVSMASTIVRDLCQWHGSQLNFSYAGETQNSWTSVPSRAVDQEIQRKLAMLRPSASNDLSTCAQWLGGLNQPGLRVVVISTRSIDDALAANPDCSDLSNALWVDCTDHQRVLRYFRPKTSRSNNKHAESGVLTTPVFEHAESMA